MQENTTTTCALCNRELAEPYNRHHLIPVSKGGRQSETLLMHKICHDKIHAVFTETELKKYYHTIHRLHQHQEVSKFIKWIVKKNRGSMTIP